MAVVAAAIWLPLAALSLVGIVHQARRHGHSDIITAYALVALLPPVVAVLAAWNRKAARRREARYDDRHPSYLRVASATARPSSPSVMQSAARGVLITVVLMAVIAALLVAAWIILFLSSGQLISG